jgi:hypothetical protein
MAELLHAISFHWNSKSHVHLLSRIETDFASEEIMLIPIQGWNTYTFLKSEGQKKDIKAWLTIPTKQRLTATSTFLSK